MRYLCCFGTPYTTVPYAHFSSRTVTVTSNNKGGRAHGMRVSMYQLPTQLFDFEIDVLHHFMQEYKKNVEGQFFVSFLTTPFHVLHWGPFEGSRNGEEVLSYQHGHPADIWQEPDEENPLSLVDQVCIFLIFFKSLLDHGWQCVDN